MNEEIEQLRRELAESRETNRRLNRRCQEAESLAGYLIRSANEVRCAAAGILEVHRKLRSTLLVCRRWTPERAESLRKLYEKVVEENNELREAAREKK